MLPGLRLAEVELRLQVLGQEDDEAGHDDQLHAGTEAGGEVHPVGQQLPDTGRQVRQVLPVVLHLLLLLGRQHVLRLLALLGPLLQGVLGVQVNLPLLLLELLGEGEEGHRDGEEEDADDEEAAPPHAHPVPGRGGGAYCYTRLENLAWSHSVF